MVDMAQILNGQYIQVCKWSIVLVTCVQNGWAPLYVMSSLNFFEVKRGLNVSLNRGRQSPPFYVNQVGIFQTIITRVMLSQLNYK